jgi:hypothetical protein
MRSLSLVQLRRHQGGEMTRGWNAWQNAGLPSIPSVFALVSSGSVGIGFTVPSTWSRTPWGRRKLPFDCQGRVVIEDNDLGRVTAVEAGGGCAVDDLGVAGATAGLRVIKDEVGLAKTAGVLWAQSGSRCRARQRRWTSAPRPAPR